MDTIYVEYEVREHPRTQKILDRFPAANVISINRYGEIFNPNTQNFRTQKLNPSLILAKKHGNLVLPTPPEYHIGGQNNFYFSHMLNCIYDCRYCFLQGMYASANYVVFVNFEDYFDTIRATAEQTTDGLWFFSGYDCDSLALEPVTDFIAESLRVFKQLPAAGLELRTKSTQIRALLSHTPLDNCVVAYSMTPAAIARELEHKTPSVEKRIQAMEKLQQAGWKLGLRFDPLIRAENFEQLYSELFDDIFNRLRPEAIHSVTVGAFRLPQPFFRKLERLYPDEPLLADQFETRSKMVSYKEQVESEMLTWCKAQLLEKIPQEKLFSCSYL